MFEIKVKAASFPELQNKLIQAVATVYGPQSQPPKEVEDPTPAPVQEAPAPVASINGTGRGRKKTPAPAPVQEAPAPAEQVHAPAPAAQASATPEAVADALRNLSKRTKNAKLCMDILKEFGANSVSKVKPENAQAFIDRCNSATSAGQ